MKRRMFILCMMFCMFAVFAAGVKTAEAKKITSISQAEEKAKKKVKDAVVTEAEMDSEHGEQVYEITLRKGTRKYEVTYRARDGKNLHYSWEEKDVASVDVTKVLKRKECKRLAKKKVKKAKITSLRKKYDDGIAIYKVKLKKGNKKYTLEYLVEGKKLIGYEWDWVKKSKKTKDYISSEQAKKIALEKVFGGKVIKCKLDKDGGVPQYEVEILCGDYEYEITIHAKTGKVLEIEKEYWD